MPDGVLVPEFKRWFEEDHKRLKPPIAESGPPAPNSKFDKDIFDRWRSAKIVEYADLLAWRARLGPQEKKEWPKSKLGRQIGRDTSKDVNTTDRILKQAIACCHRSARRSSMN